MEYKDIKTADELETCNARESSGRLDADRNVDRNDIAKDKEVK